MKDKVVFCWSGGKDSALALYKMLRDDRYDVVALLTTCNPEFKRISMHGVRIELAQAQARAIGLPLDIVWVGTSGSNDEYERQMAACLSAHKERGVAAVAFGDIFLEDLRAWREDNLARIGLRAIFPLWKIDTPTVIGEFIDLGFESIVCCVSDAYLGESDVGRPIDREFINALPPEVDPCGENGEFHSFACAGPIFRNRIDITVGEKVYRRTEPPLDGGPNGFWFCDLLPRDE